MTCHLITPAYIHRIRILLRHPLVRHVLFRLPQPLHRLKSHAVDEQFRVGGPCLRATLETTFDQPHQRCGRNRQQITEAAGGRKRWPSRGQPHVGGDAQGATRQLHCVSACRGRRVFDVVDNETVEGQMTAGR